LTDSGLKYVQELDINDRVFTHDGQMERIVGIGKKVVSPNSTLVRENGTIIRVDGELDDLHVTSDHNILVKVGDNVEYKLAYEVQIDDYIAIPRIKCPGTKGSMINLDMAWFLGLYMRNGVLIEKGDTTMVSACFPKEMNESDIQKFCQNSGQLGAEKVDAKFDERVGKYWVHIQGDTLVQVVRDLFHRADSNTPTKVPVEFHSWTLDQKTQFLLGVLAGCSHRIEALTNRQSWLCHSLEMSFGLYFIASSLGITIEHTIDLWDFQGIIDSRKEVHRDENYIYKRVFFKKDEPFVHETYVYGIEVEHSNTMCLGASLIAATLQ
jgi:hypothetical protein